MTYAKFLTADYVFKYTVVDSNVDPNIIDKYIIKAQDLNIQSVLGNNLYVKMMNDIATTGTCPGLYYDLLTQYVQKCQVEWVVYHSLPFINYRLTNKAVSLKSSDNSVPGTVGDLQYLREQVRNDAEFYSTRIKEYIINNQGSFPEYFQYGPNKLQIVPQPDAYFSGIYTDRNLWNYDRRTNTYPNAGTRINIWPGC